MYDHLCLDHGIDPRIVSIAELLWLHSGRLIQRLRDSKNGQATEYFVPEEGLDLKEGRYLPPVLVHEFGILGLGFIDNDFYQEMSHNKEVGIVFTVPK